MEDTTRRTIKMLEGLKLEAYKDAGGHSIGYGHFIKPGEEHLKSGSITKEQAEEMLTKDIEAHQAGINKWLKRPMSEAKKAALTSLAYNAGAHSSGVKKIVDLYNQGKDAEASAAFAEINKSLNTATGVKEVNPALVSRREFEARLFNSSDDVDVKKLYAEVHGGGKKGLSVASSGSYVRAGALDVAASDNKNIFAQLQELNLSLGANGGASSEFMQRLRREGGSGGMA